MDTAIVLYPLIQSALGGYRDAKLRGSLGECRQCGSAMSRNEEARVPGRMGLRLGRVGGRASPHWAKTVDSASLGKPPALAYAVSVGRSDPVKHAITLGAWLGHITDEVPRRLPPWAGVTAGYKQLVKGQRDAPVAGTVSYRPRLQGCQQRHSSPDPPAGWDERLNRTQSVSAPVTRIVSVAAQATKWPAGTSSRQPAFNAKKHSHGDCRC